MAGKEVLIVVDGSLSQINGVAEYLRRAISISSTAAITTVFDGDHTAGLEPAKFANLEAIITFSYNRAWAGLWPAIDVDASRASSDWLAQMPTQHRELTLQSRSLLLRYRGLQVQFEKRGEAGLFYLADAAQETQNAVRGQRLDHFLTQVLPVNELRTGRLGQLVPLDKTLRGAQAILEGQYDQVDKDKLAFIGSI